LTDRIKLILGEIVRKNCKALHKKIEERRSEMKKNNIEHYKLYELLGFSREEGYKIDLYQNIGRFLYKYAGAILEDTTTAILSEIKGGQIIRIPNTISPNPKNFEIDSFVRDDNKAHE